MPARAVWRAVVTSGPNTLALSWKSDTPIPSLAALNRTSPAARFLPAIPMIAWLTAFSTCFSALVMMHALPGAPIESHWSTSTPMP